MNPERRPLLAPPSFRGRLRAQGTASRRAAAAVLAVLLAGCSLGSGVDGETDAAPTERAAPAVLERVVFEGYAQGEREVEVLAASAQVDPSTRIARLSGVKISFEDVRRGAIVVKAEGARLDLASDDFVLLGAVDGTTASGERFVGEEIRYDARTRKLRSDRPVRVYRQNMTLTGDGMEIDVETRRVKIEGRVRTTVRSE